MTEHRPSICRNCLAYCPIMVTVEDGRATKVIGDPNDTPYNGYICPKGRVLPDQHNDPNRLLHPRHRDAGGGFERIGSEQAVDEVTEILREIIARDGVHAIAMYTGTGVVSNPTGQILDFAFFRALGSRMVFTAATIDKPGANTSTALHGNWMAGAQRFETADTWLIVGANPVLAKSNGAPFHNPGIRLKEAQQRGLKLIVIDPRETETAKRAYIHLQPLPGEDPTLLAAMLHVILAEQLYDAAFVADNARGLDELRQAVAPFTPAYAEARAKVPVDQLVEAARTFAAGPTGSAVCSTGPSFARHGDLSFYLALCLNTVCGRWGRPGMRAAYQNILLPPYTPKAQAYPPYPVFGAHEMRNGMRQNASGMPAAALADEILLDGPGQIKALFCIGGNPLASWPDQAKARAALEKLELLVVFDYRLTATAELAHYVVPPPLLLEIPGATNRVEALKYAGVSRGFEMPWAQYADAVVPEPAGSDLMDDGEFFFRIAQRLGLQMEWINAGGYGPHVETTPVRIPLDMERMPSVAEMTGYFCQGSRVPLDTVRAFPHGHLFDEIEVVVEPKEDGWPHRLELADPLMMGELADVVREADVVETVREFPFLLMPRRANHFMNSVGQSLPALGRNMLLGPVHMHPDDMALFGLVQRQPVRLRSTTGTLLGEATADPTLRRGTVTTFQGLFADPEGIAPSVTALYALEDCDKITGMPRMSAIRVAVEPASPDACTPEPLLAAHA